ncbi:YchF family ATPase [Patescibacteria group bacterium]|nr:YchF family ATPase [Patescibacteria group bacterium]
MNKLSLGIIGLPNVGKSTLFGAVTKNSVNIANYPFCTIDPNIGIVSVPDERLDKLDEMSKSAKKIPAIVEFYDIAGLVRGANKGEGLGNKFLSHIRETNAVVEVLRCFESSEIVHVENSIDPIRDMEIINAELSFKDLDTVEKVMKTLEAEARSGNKESAKDLEILKIAKEKILKGDLLVDMKDEPIINKLQLLTSKPQIYLLNGKQEDVSEELIGKIKELGADYIIRDLSEQKDLGELIKKSYSILNLISFFTTGEDETRAWTIVKDEKAPQASGTIHTDFEKSFIRAETINWSKLLEAGSWSKAKQKGWIRSEGKEYVVNDGDVIEVKHG